jgi:hypothetical protein
MFQARAPACSFRIVTTNTAHSQGAPLTGENQAMTPTANTIGTTIEPSVLRAFEPVAFDLYRDIHKGIRAELFALTGAAGSVDPADRAGRSDLACHVHTVADMLVMHAEHEDTALQPVLESYLPARAEQVAIDHPVLEARIAAIRDLADNAIEAPSFASRSDLHRVYLELASFTSAYLAHQDLEEREIMPALARAIDFEQILAIHQSIVGAIPPDVLAKSLAVMLPAMNVDDRTELLGGMQQNAPAEEFAGVFGLARSVLTPADGNALARRLGVA